VDVRIINEFSKRRSLGAAFFYACGKRVFQRNGAVIVTEEARSSCMGVAWRQVRVKARVLVPGRRGPIPGRCANACALSAGGAARPCRKAAPLPGDGHVTAGGWWNKYLTHVNTLDMFNI